MALLQISGRQHASFQLALPRRGFVVERCNILVLLQLIQVNLQIRRPDCKILAAGQSWLNIVCNLSISWLQLLQVTCGCGRPMRSRHCYSQQSSSTIHSPVGIAIPQDLRGPDSCP